MPVTDIIKNVSPIGNTLPVGTATDSPPREFSPREGQVYSARVKGFSEGAALVSIDNRYLLALSDLAVKTGEQILLKLVGRGADGKFIFKLADSPAGTQITARERSAADILKSVGADPKNPQAAAVLESHLKFGLRLDARSIDGAAAALNRVLNSAAGAEAQRTAGEAPAQPEGGRAPAGAESATPLPAAKTGVQTLADAATLLTKSNIPVNQESLKLASALIETLRGQSLDFNRVFSSARSSLAVALAGIIPDLENGGKRAAYSAKRVLGAVTAFRSFENGAVRLLEALAAARPEGAERAGGAMKKSAAFVKEALTLIAELEKFSGGGIVKNPGELAAVRENIINMLESRAMTELYSAISGGELFKFPFNYDDEEHEALCALEKEDGRVVAVDMYLTLSRLDSIRVNIKKKESAAGIYIFVKNAEIKRYIESKYFESKQMIDSAINSPYYFTVVVGKKIDFLPPVLKYSGGGDIMSALDISV
ncbi:MAG: hypothetical protein A2008_09870 [Candidatus Wallbacteria bacterium GWC2_49_35]|uniref:Uncharacterized protein n=1 Tax=Candidatus Wallbacteria bacterium GWC2_49_35 TaxID=1817813 RepID=A0A1F7WDR0_9BACT|nr:MAG: hypothetical protein A2008_09870 [Candidatus Wallbacteria bacterium GWC2_49_35]HBC75960.1 hypothetical protein [Candidatus Wallbacteria bacterium]